MTNGIGDRRPSHKGAWHGTGQHRTEFEHSKKLPKQTSVSYIWNAFYKKKTETTAKQTMWLNPCEVIILDYSLNLKSRLLNDTKF